MGNYFLRVLIWIDQGANVMLSPVLNRFVIRGGALFGSADETLSSVFGKNQRTGTCKACTWICKHVLHRLDKQHCEKSIEADEGVNR